MRALHDRTDGLPLFVADVVSDLIARGEPGIEGVGPGAHCEIAVPESLTAIIDHYIARPGDDALWSRRACAASNFESPRSRMLERDVASVSRIR